MNVALPKIIGTPGKRVRLRTSSDNSDSSFGPLPPAPRPKETRGVLVHCHQYAQWKLHPPLCHPERSRGICSSLGLRHRSAWRRNGNYTHCPGAVYWASFEADVEYNLTGPKRPEANKGEFALYGFIQVDPVARRPYIKEIICLLIFPKQYTRYASIRTGRGNGAARPARSLPVKGMPGRNS
jgi:hypothetical protein